MTWRDIDRERRLAERERILAAKEERREAKTAAQREEAEIKARWHIQNAERELAYCERMLAQYRRKAEDLRVKVEYFQSVGLPCGGYQDKLFKAEDNLFKHEQRVSAAELERDVWQHRLDNLDVLF